MRGSTRRSTCGLPGSVVKRTVKTCLLKGAGQGELCPHRAMRRIDNQSLELTATTCKRTVDLGCDATRTPIFFSEFSFRTHYFATIVVRAGNHEICVSNYVNSVFIGRESVAENNPYLAYANLRGSWLENRPSCSAVNLVKPSLQGLGRTTSRPAHLGQCVGHASNRCTASGQIPAMGYMCA